MAKFIITTDSSCDCAIDELKQKNIPVVFFEYADGTKTLVDDMNEENYIKKSDSIYDYDYINSNLRRMFF